MKTDIKDIDIVNIDYIYNKIHRIDKIDSMRVMKVRNKPIPKKKFERNKKLNHKKWIIPIKGM